MQQVKPGRQLIADTTALLQAPTHRRPPFIRPVIMAASAVLVCAAALPLLGPGNTPTEPVTLSAAGGITVFDDAAGAGNSPAAKLESDIAVCSAIRPAETLLTEQELADLPQFAAYLPQAPAGMALSTASLREDGTLFVSYNDNGYNYLTLVVRTFTDADTSRLVSLDAPQTWDRSACADEPICNLPQEYQLTMGSAIFLPQDISADVVAKRAANGDMEGKYIRFGVKDDATLLEYTAHTTDVDSIWQAISTAPIFNRQ